MSTSTTPPSKQPDTFLVEHAGSVGCYFVASQSRIGKHLVDLLAYNGAGECACEDWRYRRKAIIEQGATDQQRYCRHVAAAREFMLNDVIQRILKGLASGA